MQDSVEYDVIGGCKTVQFRQYKAFPLVFPCMPPIKGRGALGCSSSRFEQVVAAGDAREL